MPQGQKPAAHDPREAVPLARRPTPAGRQSRPPDPQCKSKQLRAGLLAIFAGVESYYDDKESLAEESKELVCLNTIYYEMEYTAMQEEYEKRKAARLATIKVEGLAAGKRKVEKAALTDAKRHEAGI